MKIESEKQYQLDCMYMNIAREAAKISKGVRAQVGSCLVTVNGVILIGVNGLPKNLGNSLEYEEGDVLITKPETIHAEMNSILKASREGVSCLK